MHTAELVIVAVLMGCSIAIDVFIATITRFKDSSLSLQNWTVPITITHITFPALGYILFWYFAVMART